MDNKIWSISGLVIGFLLCYLFVNKPPDVKMVTEIRQVTKKEIVNKDRIIDRETIKYKDGTVKIVEKEVIKDRVVTDVVEKEKIVDKTVNYMGAVSIGMNPFNTSELILTAQYDVFKPLFLEAIVKGNFSSTYIAIGLRF